MLRRMKSARNVFEGLRFMIPRPTWPSRRPQASGRSTKRSPTRPARARSSRSWPPVSSAFAHQPRLVALPVPVLHGLPLVMGFLAFGQGQFHFRASAGVEIDRQRDQRHALPLDRPDQLLDLPVVQEQLARTLGLVIEAVAVAEFGNVRIDQPGLAVAHFSVSLGDRTFAEAEAFHFGAA